MCAALIEIPPIDFKGIGNLVDRIGQQVNQTVCDAYKNKFINSKEIQALFPLLEKLETEASENFDFDKWYAYRKEDE